MGRKKIEIKLIESAIAWQVTYKKRHSGLLKKAFELGKLYDIDIMMIMFSESGRLTTYCPPETTIEKILCRFLNTPVQEQTKAQIENLEFLAKIVKETGTENLELLSKIEHRLNDEKKGKDPVLGMPAGKDGGFAVQTALATKQQEIEQPLDGLIENRVKLCDSIADLNQLEISLENGLSHVQKEKHLWESLENMPILQDFQQFMSALLP